MYETGGYLPNFSEFQGGLDHYNLKPPLITFIQVLFFAVLGGSDVELAMRLPIALCVLATVLLLLWYSKRELGTYWLGMIASLVLLTSSGYVRMHVARSGDHDAVLVLFMLIGFFAFHYYLRATTDKERNKYLVLLTLMLLLGFLTKSLVGFFFVPGFVLYALCTKQLLPILRRPSTYWTALFLVLSVVGYYALMEYVISPGYLQGEREHALGRYFTPIGHSKGFPYYFTRFYESAFEHWLYFLPLGILAVFSQKAKQFKAIGQLAVCCCAMHLLIISCSENKLSWYDAAMYPLLALLVSIGIYQVGKQLMEWAAASKYIPTATIVVYIGLLFFIVPYSKIVKEYTHYKLKEPNDQFGYMMKKIAKKHDLKTYYVLAKDALPQPQLYFYTGYYNRTQDYNITIIETAEGLQPNEHIMLCQGSKLKAIKDAYSYEQIDNFGKSCYLLKIK